MEVEKVFKHIMFSVFDIIRVGIDDKQRLACVRDHVGDFFREWIYRYSQTNKNSWWVKAAEKQMLSFENLKDTGGMEYCSLHEFLMVKRDHECFRTGLEDMAYFIFGDDTKKQLYFLDATLTKVLAVLKASRPNN